MNTSVAIVLGVFAAATLALPMLASHRYVRIAVCILPWVVSVVEIIRFRRATLLIQSPLNPDEALFLASAIKTQAGGWIPWVDVDSGTVGPLVPDALLPGLLALPDAPYFGARMLGIICIVAMAIGVALLGRRVLGWPVAQLFASLVLMLAVIPAAVDLYTYSSELLPLAFAVLGMGLAVDADGKTNPRLWQFGLGFFLLGLVPYAKLQVLPVAAVWALVILLRGGHQSGWRNRRRLLVGLTAAAAPTLLLLVGLMTSGAFRAGFGNSITFLQGYAGGSSQGYTVVTLFLEPSIVMELVVLGVLAAVIAVILTFLLARIALSSELRTVMLVALGAPVGLASMILPGRYFPHYLWVGLIPAVVAVVAVGVVACDCVRESDRWLARGSVVGAVVLLGVSLVLGGPLTLEPRAPESIGVEGWSFTPLGDPTQRQVAEILKSCQGELAVWGWDPHIYVVSGRSHWTSGAALMSPSDPFATRWIDRAAKELPDCIVDASGPNQFAFGIGMGIDAQVSAVAFLRHYQTIFSSENYRVYQLVDR